MKKILTLLTVLGFITQVYSQGKNSGDIIERSLTAYGDWNKIETFEYEVKGSRDAGAQAKTYKNGDHNSYYSKRTYNLPHRQLHENNKGYYPGGYIFNFAATVNDSVLLQYDVLGSRSGKTYQTGGKADADRRLSSVNNHLAYFKVRELKNSMDSFREIDNETNEYIVLRRFNNENPIIADYYFSKEDYLLHQYTAGKEDIKFLDYKNNDGRTDNTSVAFYSDGKFIYKEEISVSKINFNFNPEILELPKDYIKAESRPVSGPHEIEKDIYLIENLPGNRNVLFVNMVEYIVVIEAPISSDLSKQIIAIIKETLPGKPIKYVFTTHYHNDHTGGLRQYVYESAELIMAPHTREYVHEIVTEVRNDDLGANGKDVSFKIMEEVFILKDKNHTIEFHQVPNSHSDGMALVYFPNEKIIYQGDLLSIPSDGTITPPIEVTIEMFQFLENKNLEFKRMIGHHGHNHITPEMLDMMMAEK